jgi:UDP-N-acetyl-D-galactosamine dehydrogenase
MDYTQQLAVVGLGYVGLPLALEFAKKYPVVGFDIDHVRVRELQNGYDRTREVEASDLISNIVFSAKVEDIGNANIYIVTVPTPIDNFYKPNLLPILKATEMIGSVLKKGDLVIYESTVYPGCTEEDCVPVLENTSGLKFNQDFFCGYSPERINPGDKTNTLTTIKKVTSGSTAAIANEVNELYKSIIVAGTHLAPSIKVAEASKAIENAQRDINISFVNELALIFDRMNIDTNDVLDAAATKWNFLKYQPGLVGGHCIGVDPYYLAHKAESLGYHPQVILSGRRVNNQMGQFVASKVIKLMIQKNHKINGAKVLINGFTFKENCPDIRNSKVIDIYTELKAFGLDVHIYDPWANAIQVKKEYDIDLIELPGYGYDAVILAVSHDSFNTLDLHKIANDNAVIFDTKSVMSRGLVDARL